jgi:hypothetical protein
MVSIYKGGEFRKWYGNHEYIVNWYNDGEEVKNLIDSDTGRIRSHNYNGQYGFQSGFTWSGISSGTFAVALFHLAIYLMQKDRWVLL